jgi:hypothetical protein
MQVDKHQAESVLTLSGSGGANRFRLAVLASDPSSRESGWRSQSLINVSVYFQFDTYPMALLSLFQAHETLR